MNQTNSSARLTFLLPNLNAGGAERVFIQLANRFAKLGFSVDLLLLQKTGVMLPEVSAQVNIVDMGISNMYLCLPKLIPYLKKVKPAVLLSTLEFTSLTALLARRISGVNSRAIVVVSVAISRHRRSRIKKMIERYLISRIYPWADKVVTVSLDTMRDLIEYANLPAEKVQTIYNPIISDELLLQADEAISHRFYQDGQPPVIVGVGRFSEQKDFPTLIRAFSIVRENTPARLLILGEGKDRAALEDLIRSLGLEQEVDLPGFVSNPFAYLRRSAVFALSSRWEGLPSVLIEALACGCPVVSTDCPTGPVEILDGEKYGHLAPAGDPEALAQAILKSLQGDQRKPPASWLDQFRVEPVVRQYLNIMGLE